MINCEKCGNPLQPGSTTCPICGTVAKSLESAITAEPMNNEPIESLDEPPIAAAPLINPGVSTQPTVSPSAPIAPNGPSFAVSDFAAPTAQPAQPAMFTDQGFNNIGINAGAPAAPAVAPATPSGATETTAPSEKTTPKKEKKSNNMLATVLVAVVALGIGVGLGFFVSSSMTKPVQQPGTNVANAVETNENGYTFNIEQGWTPSTISGKLIITNEDESVTIRTFNNEGQFANINTSNIEVSLSTKNGYTNIEAEKTKLGEKDVVIVNAKNGECLIQYYYMPHDVNNVIFTTVIYQTQEAKDANEEAVKAIIESLKYTESVQNAIEALDVNGELFGDSLSLYYESFANLEEETTE